MCVCARVCVCAKRKKERVGGEKVYACSEIKRKSGKMRGECVCMSGGTVRERERGRGESVCVCRERERERESGDREGRGRKRVRERERERER